MKNNKSLNENTEVIYKPSLDFKEFFDYLHNIDTNEAKKNLEEAEKNMNKQLEEEKAKADNTKDQ